MRKILKFLYDKKVIKTEIYAQNTGFVDWSKVFSSPLTCYPLLQRLSWQRPPENNVSPHCLPC